MRKEVSRRHRAGQSIKNQTRSGRASDSRRLTGSPAILNHQAIRQLQTTVGNARVQTLLESQAAGLLSVATMPVRIAREEGEPEDMGADSAVVTGTETETEAQEVVETATGAPSVVVPEGKFKVTDKKARLRQPPPNLAEYPKGKPIIEKDTKVKVLEALQEPDGALYARVSDTKGKELGWTSVSNMSKLKEALLELNPQLSEFEMREGDVADAVPGLPAAPEITHQAYLDIVQEMEQMEQNPLLYERVHGEELGEARAARVAKIKQLRQQIADLATTLTDLDEGAIKEAQAYLYRRLNPLAPYYGQMANANLLAYHYIDEDDGLAKTESGWDRTCNVTVPAMVLEGLGKSKADYDQSQLPLLRRIFDALEGQYLARKEYSALTSFDTLRFPDFLALIGIAYRLPAGADPANEAAFVQSVADARDEAGEKTTHHDTMVYLLEALGATVTKHSYKSDTLGEIGAARKGYTKAILSGLKPTDEQAENYASIDADKKLKVSEYRDYVLKNVNPILDRGSQVLVGMRNHFVRLDGLDKDGIQMDDPGGRALKSVRVTWEQARDMGTFKGYWEISD